MLTARERWNRVRDYYQPILKELERQRDEGSEDSELESDIRDLRAHMQLLLPIGSEVQPRELKVKLPRKTKIGQYKQRAARRKTKNGTC